MKNKFIIPLIALIVASFVIPVMAKHSGDGKVEAHGHCTDISVDLSLLYEGGPFVEDAEGGSWKVTAEPDDNQAKFYANAKTSEGTIRFELVNVISVTKTGYVLTIVGEAKVKLKGDSYTFEATIEVDWISQEMTLDLESSGTINLVGHMKPIKVKIIKDK